MPQSVQKPPKRHHIISRFYLEQFSHGEKIEVFDLKRKKRRNTDIKSLSQLCVQNNFNTIKDDHYPPDWIEKALSKLEAKTKTAIDNISNTKKFEGEDRAFVLELLACFFIRKPEKRASFNASMSQLFKVMLDLSSRVPVGSKVNGYRMTEELHQALQYKDNIEVAYDKTSLIAMELKSLNKMLQLLHARKWYLLCAPSNSHFITSDNPVVLIWKEGEINRPVGLECPNTQIFFTISKNFAIIGDFEGADEVALATEENMATVNSNIRLFANLWVFSPGSNFYYFNENGDVVKNSGEFY